MMRTPYDGGDFVPRDLETVGLFYVLPHSGFFTTSGLVGGHLAHAQGFVAAAEREWGRVTVICAPDGRGLFSSLGVEVLAVSNRTQFSRVIWSAKILSTIERHLQKVERPAACYVRYAGRFAWALPLLKRILRGVPLVLEVNSLGTQYRRAMRVIDSRAVRAADLVVAVSGVVEESVKEVARSRCPPVLVVPNGVDLQRFRVCPDELELKSSANTSPRVGYVGVLKPNYGLEDLIGAFRIVRARFPEARLDIVGDGPLRSLLETLARDVGGVTIHKPVPFSEVPSVLRSMDVLVCPQSPVNVHVSPMKLFEYLAAGRAVVAAAIPQVVGIAQVSNAFLTYRCGDVCELAERICDLLASDEVRLSFAKRALDEAKKHSWEERVRMVRNAVASLG
jgi:Glycosyltransferase